MQKLVKTLVDALAYPKCKTSWAASQGLSGPCG